MQVEFNEEGKTLNEVFNISSERTKIIKDLVVKAVNSDETHTEMGELGPQKFIIRSLSDAATFCENENEVAYLYYLGSQAFSKATNLLSLLRGIMP